MNNANDNKVNKSNLLTWALENHHCLLTEFKQSEKCLELNNLVNISGDHIPF